MFCGKHNYPCPNTHVNAAAVSLVALCTCTGRADILEKGKA